MLHNKKWKIQSNEDIRITCDLHPLVKQILVNRGFNDDQAADAFLYPKIDNLYDPFLMKDMERAVKRLKTAIDLNQKIWIYGDYDVDGITSISVLLKFFNLIDYPVNYYIPNRLEEGYGLSIGGMEKILDQGADLIISVDCGITSNEEVAYVNERHKDIIITDHHNCQYPLPEAYAILNPKQEDCDYPFDMLAGVGIAFKLIQAYLGQDLYNHLDLFLDIVALGTIADIAPLVDENRILAKLGLEIMGQTSNQGLKALLEISGLEAPLNAGHVGFKLGPKINAAGRIGRPDYGVHLLMAKDHVDSKTIALQLHELNEKRQNIEKDILDSIDDLIQDQVDLKHHRIIVILGEDWHSGVIGIVASRITEKYHKPAIILTKDKGIAKGSARSVGDVSIFDAMKYCQDLFLGFGGHKQAAGLSLEIDQVDAFREKINQYALDHLTEEDLLPRVQVDGILHPKDIQYQALDDLELLEPFGLKNPKPHFVYNNLTVDDVRAIGKEKTHAKLTVHDEKRTYDALAFGAADLYKDMRSEDHIDMVLSLQKNEFRGISTIQFMVKDVRRLEPEFYKNHEIGKLFTKTLARSLFYNGKCVSKQGKSVFTAHGYGTGNRLDYATEISNKKLVLVNGFKNFLELYFRLDDLNISPGSYGIHYNLIDGHHQLDVLLHPYLNKIDYERYDEVIVYDALYSQHWADLLETHCLVPIQYLTQMLSDEKDQTQALYTGIPFRMDLVEVYKFLLSEDGHLAISLYDFAKALHMDNVKCELSLRILEGLKLIEIKGDETYHISVLPKPSEKLALDETEIYKRVSSIRDDFFDYVRAYQGLVKP